MNHIVARGTLIPSLPTEMCHGVKIGKKNYKVTVDEVIDGSAPLPISSFDIASVGDAKGAFVAWPIDLVILPSDEVLFDIAVYILSNLFFIIILNLFVDICREVWRTHMLRLIIP